jgi:LysM repeat protein
MKSMGGTNDHDNLVKLTAREHFLAHWLLWRIHRNRETAYALYCMNHLSNNDVRRSTKFSSIAYQESKEALTKVGYSDSRKAKISAALKGKPKSITHRETLKLNHKGMSGKKHSAQWREDMLTRITGSKTPHKRTKELVEILKDVEVKSFDHLAELTQKSYRAAEAWSFRVLPELFTKLKNDLRVQ